MNKRSRCKAKMRRVQRSGSGVNRLCYLFGHEHSNIDLIMAKVKSNDLSRGWVPNVLKCRRCCKILDLNDNGAIDESQEWGKVKPGFFDRLWFIVSGKNLNKVKDGYK